MVQVPPTTLSVRLRARWPLLVAVVAAVVIPVYVLSPALRSEWLMFDDHGIALYLGRDRIARWSELAYFLEASAIINEGAPQRANPVFYVVRAVEAVLFGDNLYAWHAARIGMVASGFGIFTALLAQYVGPLIGLVTALSAFNAGYWAELGATLGAAETYAWFFASLWALSAHAVLHSVRPGVVAWLLNGTFALLAMFSKESMMFMALFQLGLVVLAMRRPGWSICARLVNIAVGIGWLLGVSRMARIASELSGQSGVTLQDRLAQAALGGAIAIAGASMFFAMVWSTIIRLLAQDRTNAWRLFVRSAGPLGIIVCNAVMVAFQFFLYADRGAWWVSRYAFPAFLAPYIIAASLMVLFSRMQDSLGHRGNAHAGGATVRLSRGLVIAFVCGGIAFAPSFQPVREHVDRFVSATVVYSSTLRQILHTAGDRAIVLVTGGTVAEYEPMVSLARFLRFFGHDRVFVRLNEQAGLSAADPFLKMSKRVSEFGLVGLRGASIVLPASARGVDEPSIEVSVKNVALRQANADRSQGLEWRWQE